MGTHLGPRDLAKTAVPQVGRLVATGDPVEPYRLVGPDGAAVEARVGVLRRPSGSRAFGGDASLLRDGPAALVPLPLGARGPWDRATRDEARDFSLLVAGRRQAGPAPLAPAGQKTPTASQPLGSERYAASVRAHSETVLRSFYEFHREAGTGPIMNPFPLDRSRRGGRARRPPRPDGALPGRTGRPLPASGAGRVPRAVPDEVFNEIFARLASNRDRALVAFYVSTGARASELLSATQGGVDPGRQLVTVVRKGSRQAQELPASVDAFVWLRLYQVEIEGLVPKGRRQPLWWTLRRPFRPLNYQAAHRMFERANRLAGTRCDAARAPPHRRLPDGRGPRAPPDRRPVGARPRPALDDPGLPDPAQGGRGPPRARPPRRPGPPARPSARAPLPAPGYRQESLDVLFARPTR